jgi:hypothetical protein
MAFVATLTGTARNVTATLGSPNVTITNTSGFVVGATVVGMAWPAGTKIVSFVTNTSAVFSTNYPSASGTGTCIFSSVYGSTLTIQATASGDAPTWQNVFNAGFGLLQGSRSLFHPGALTIVFGSIVAGARFDHQDWTVEIGTGGRMLFDSGLLAGEQRGGYFQAGALLIKCDGPTFVFNNWNNATPGGSSLFQNTGGLLTMGGLFRMHNPRFVARTGNNMCPAFVSVRDNMLVENIIMDYEGDAGPNASIGCGYGTILNPKIIKANSGITRSNTTSSGTISGLYYLGLFTDNPSAKFSIPDGSIMDGYTPQITSSQNFGGFQANSTETYSNIDLSSAGFGLSNIPARYLRFGGPNEIRFPRTVSFEFNDSTGENLTDVTLYIRSGSTSLINEVQAGDYSALSQGIVLNWTGTGGYRVANTTINTISQVAQVRKYGFIQQSTSYSINLAPYSQPFFMLPEDALNGISEATAAAITTAGINWTTKTITPTANLTYDQINARIAWELAQTTNSAQADPRTILGDKVSLATGWSLIINNGIVITTGVNITQWFTPTITLNGTGQITAVYQDSAGTSTVLELNPPSDDYSLCIFRADGTTKYFASDVNAGSYYVYFAPNEAGTYFLAAEKYGQRRTEDTLVLNGGNVWYNITDQEDVGITDDFATASAYTTLSTTSEIYDATAVFRLSEAGIKLGQLVARDGLYLDFGNYNVKIKDDASAIIAVASGTITYKSIVVNSSAKYNAMKATPPKTITPTDTEIINVLIEDANGDSQVSILGGDNLGYELWKVTTATATDDYATGTLLTTLATNAAPYRFIGISGFDIVGRDVSSGVRRRSSMLKGSYTQAFYVGDQIQLATNAPQLIENNEKLDELILKVETNLDAKVSTRLADADYIEPATPQDVTDAKAEVLTAISEIPTTDISALALETTAQSIKTKLDTLENADFTTTNTLIIDLGNPMQTGDSVVADIKAKVDTLENTDLTGIATATNVTDAKNEIIAEIGNIDVDLTGVALEETSQEIKTKVLTLSNYDDATAQSKLDDIKLKVDTLENTDLTEVTEDLTIINNGVKKASLLIPHTDNI